MKGVEYRSTGIHEIDTIRELWEELNNLHREKTPHFKPHYERMSFEDRKRELQKVHQAGSLHLDIVRDPATAMPKGYCPGVFSGYGTDSAENTGIVESLFVDASYRSRGIGTVLMNRGLAWMDSHRVCQKRAAVSAGNESALPFYKKIWVCPADDGS
jgi:GNAT superfamily N-acetyltransferase